MSFLMNYVEDLNGIDKINQCKKFINNAKKIAIISGAGMSTDSGIPDFRSKKGLYSKNPSDILSIQNFSKRPKEVYLFIKQYVDIIENKKPNKGHYLLKKLEEKNKEVFIITQNIDKLHSYANSKNVFEVHGTLETATCQKCNKKYKIKDIIKSDGSFNYICDCKEKGLIKPDCVFFGEDIKYLSEIKKIISECDLLFVLGTSMTVQPIASLPNYLKAETPIIIINKDNTYLDDDRMSIVFHDKISDILQKLID